MKKTRIIVILTLMNSCVGLNNNPIESIKPSSSVSSSQSSIPSSSPSQNTTIQNCPTLIKPDISTNNISTLNEIPDNVTEGSIKLIFKDEFKINYDNNENKFISSNCIDTSSINQLLNKYELNKLKIVSNSDKEKVSYTIEDIKNKNIKQIVNDLKKELIVEDLSAKFSSDTNNSTNSSNTSNDWTPPPPKDQALLDELLKNAEVVDLSKYTPQDIHGYHPDKILPWVYNDNRDIPEEITKGSISLIFIDENKIRFDKEKKQFYSLVNCDISNLNNIIEEYKDYIIETFPGGQDLTEEEAEIKENQFQKTGDYDIVNDKSSYTLVLKNNLKEIVDRFREDKNVRQCNYQGIPHPD